MPLYQRTTRDRACFLRHQWFWCAVSDRCVSRITSDKWEPVPGREVWSRWRVRLPELHCGTWKRMSGCIFDAVRQHVPCWSVQSRRHQRLPVVHGHPWQSLHCQRLQCHWHALPGWYFRRWWRVHVPAVCRGLLRRRAVHLLPVVLCTSWVRVSGSKAVQMLSECSCVACGVICDSDGADCVDGGDSGWCRGLCGDALSR
jgi:hypothetical protein